MRESVWSSLGFGGGRETAGLHRINFWQARECILCFTKPSICAKYSIPTSDIIDEPKPNTFEADLDNHNTPRQPHSLVDHES